MFAPPPVQLSRAEVEARLAAKRRIAAAAGSLSRTASTVSDSKSASLHDHDSRGSTSSNKHHVFGKGGKIKVSSPVSAPSPASPPPKKSSGVFKFTAGEEVDSPELPNGFGEHPRRAPEPPRKGTRPPSEWFERRVPGKSHPPQSPIPQVPEPSSLPPPIPAKSPRRQLQTYRQNLAPPNAQSFQTTVLNDALSSLQLGDDSTKQIDERPSHPRSLSAPSVNMPHDTILMTRPSQNRPTSERPSGSGMIASHPRPPADSKVNLKTPGRKDGKVDRPTSKRTSAADTVREALLDYDEMRFLDCDPSQPRRATEGDIDPARRGTSSELQLPWKRRKKGETIGMLLEAGFFPANSLTSNNDNSHVNVRLQPPPPQSIVNKDLPATPTSIMATPTEMYHVIPPRPSRPVVRNKNGRNKKRSPLAPISTTHAKSNPIVREAEEISPRRLPAIPEGSAISENSPVPSGLSTPVETQIQLRNGSVVTVSPPELTAWKISFYIQGPIKLPKPVIVPRKNSMASLEAFQEAIDQVYQEALNIPRRRSDDAVVDDVCEFFDDFGFDEISYEGDILGVDEILLDEVKEEPVQDLERFTTPPADPDPSPVEKVLAHDIVQVMEQPNPTPKPSIIPPVENEETLRAKGIARLAHGMASQNHSPISPTERKDSVTISKADPGVLPLLPVPEESMLEAVLEPSRAEDDNSDVQMVDRPVEESGFDWEDDVEELDGHTFWLGPRKRRGNKGQHRRQTSTTPIQRMRELAFL